METIPVNTKLAAKFRTAAEKLDATLEKLDRPGLTNTPKRQAQDAVRKNNFLFTQRVKDALLYLADCHDTGKIPFLELAEIKTKKDLEPFMCSEKADIRNGYHGYKVCTGKPAIKTPAVMALWDALAATTTAGYQSKFELQRAEIQARNAGFSGFFPTPKAVGLKMMEQFPVGPLERANVIYDPSAGAGNLLDTFREVFPGKRFFATEIVPDLFKILKMKGYDAQHVDFMDFGTAEWELPFDKADVIVMNPPFEKSQDMEHVKHAVCRFLSAGGWLGAVMSPGFAFRQDKQAEAFRQWLESLAEAGGSFDWSPLPDGSFKESGTGVSTVLLIIQKPD